MTVRILEIILEEEVGHVEIGTRWFRYCCEQQGLEPGSTFIGLLSEFFTGRIRGPFNLPARLQAGFTQQELDDLAAL